MSMECVAALREAAGFDVVNHLRAELLCLANKSEIYGSKSASPIRWCTAFASTFVSYFVVYRDIADMESIRDT
jgi:hypothetical protein